MKRYWAYLKYVVRHKYFVSVECFKMGLIWRGIKHDWSKFLLSEFGPYARHFYNANGSSTYKRDSTGHWQSPTEDYEFNLAWLKHQNRQDHHWQWWVLAKDDGGSFPLKMSNNAALEMICDWVGAGRAQGFFSPKNDKYSETRKWYQRNKAKMVLERDTQCFVEGMIL